MQITKFTTMQNNHDSLVQTVFLVAYLCAVGVSQYSDIAKQRQANQTIAIINCISTCNQNKKCETKQANYPNEIDK